MDFEKFYSEALNATDILLHNFKEKEMTFFLTKPALAAFRTETLNEPRPGYRLTLFGRPVKIVEGDEARAYIGVELDGIGEEDCPYECRKNEETEKVDEFISSVQEYAKLIHDVPGILIHPKDAERVLELLLCAEVHVTGTTQKGKIVIYKKDIVHPTTVDFPDWPMEKNI